MISTVEQDIVAAFPNKIFGFDEETLLQAVASLAVQKQSQISISSFGLQDVWPKEESSANPNVIQIVHQKQASNLSQKHFQPTVPALIQSECCFQQLSNECRMDLSIFTTAKESHLTNIYNGPSSQGPIWAMNILLESLRQTLLELYL